MGAKGIGCVVLIALGLPSCDHPKLTDADCTAIGSRVEGAWLADANEAVTVAQTEQYRRYVKDEGGRVTARWLDECRKLVGAEVDPQELRCLKKAASIDDVEHCQTR